MGQAEDQQSFTSPAQRRYGLSLWLYGRVLGLIFFIAFASLGFQLHGLVGEKGMVPAIEQLERVRAAFGAEVAWQQPTLALFGASDGALTAIGAIGALCSVLLFAGFVPGPALLGCIACYVSLVNVGGPFTRFQWDMLLIETGFASLLVTPIVLRHRLGSLAEPPRLARWLLYVLLAKLMFLSGWVKLASNDPTWADLTALTYHYWTQPLPNPVSYWAHHMPLVFHKAACLVMFGIELVVPFVALLPLALARRAAALSFTALMLAVIATGNYGFFNLLVLALCVPLLDDEIVGRALSRAKRRLGEVPPATEDKPRNPGTMAELTDRLGGALGVALATVALAAWSIWAPGEHGLRIGIAATTALLAGGLALDWYLRRRRRVARLTRERKKKQRRARSWPVWPAVLAPLRRSAVATLALVFMLGSMLAGGARLFPELRDFSRGALEDVSGLHLFNSYGLFAVMTTRRTEIVVEGSHDGKTWRAYELPYKPGALDRRPALLVGHMPRLDWQMWFAALGQYRQNPWLQRLMQALAAGEPAVIALFEHNPFPEAPPRFVRAVAYDYRFSDRASGGSWWVRGEQRLYAPAVQGGSPPVLR